MNNNKLIKLAVLAVVLAGITACKKQLNVGNPNAPTLQANVTDEAGITSLAQGSVYIDGFLNGDGWLGNSYFSLPYGYSELLGDVVGSDVANQQISGIALPWSVTYGGTAYPNPTSTTQTNLIRVYNTRGSTGAGNNATYYQWLNMYALNGSLNNVLSVIDGIKFSSGDPVTKKNTLKAWCYWWKGYAYASVGSMYYAGIINDGAYADNNNYKIKDSIIARSNYYFSQASTILSGITDVADYSEVLGNLIPSFCQVGNGGVLTPAMWIRNINTMLARNILVNKLSPFVNGNPAAVISKSSTTAMTSSDWTSVLTLATAGIQKGDYVFTGRSAPANGFFSTGSGTISAMTTGPNSSTTFKITERFMANYQANDKRLANDYSTTVNHFHDSYNYGTRYSVVDGGNGAAGVYVIGNKSTDGAYELFIAGSYEENALMLAEANIRMGNIETGLAYVDAVRAYQGAGVAATVGTELNLAEAMQVLVSERRVALVFRGLSFYDSRRWGWTYDVSVGGGYYNGIILTPDDVVHTGVAINYSFMDYWDIPADETVLNPPSSGSAAVVNPNY